MFNSRPNSQEENMNFEIIELNNKNGLSREEIDSEKTKWWTSFCLIIFAIITCLITYLGYSGVNGYNSSIQDFKYNWSLQPISDIVTTTEKCPHGYEDLVRDSWPGTITGCYKHDILIIFNGVNKGSCPEDGGRTIYSINPIPLNYFYSYRIWGKRSGNKYAYSTIPKSKAFGAPPSCPSGYKVWGSDSKTSWICVNELEKCPINDISI